MHLQLSSLLEDTIEWAKALGQDVAEQIESISTIKQTRFHLDNK